MPQNNMGPPPPSFNHPDQSNYNNLASIANAVTNAMSSIANNDSYRNRGGSYTPKSGAKAKFQCEIEVPDKMVGTILGKGGHTIGEFSRSTGSKLQFSAKEEYAPGTTNRILTITAGTMQQVQNAYMLVDERLSQV